MTSRFWGGFRAILPLWFGAVPIGISYALAARQAGFSAVETQLFSITVFSAGAQLSAINLLQAGATASSLIFTTIILHLHQVLFGLSLGRLLPLSTKERLVAAYFLNDGAYGATLANRVPSFAFLLGAELSMFVVWNVATLAGILLGQLLPNLTQLGLDFVVPLLFLALLIPQLRSRVALVTAVCAGLLAAAIGRVASPGIAVFLAVTVASCVGAVWTDNTVHMQKGPAR